MKKDILARQTWFFLGILLLSSLGGSYVFADQPKEARLRIDNQIQDIYKEVASVIEITLQETKSSSKEDEKTAHSNSPSIYTIEEFEFIGVVNWAGKNFTYYSERVLPGGALDIPGRHTSGGFVRDGDGYIVLASDAYPKGTIISTPFGSDGKVYDSFGTGQASDRFDVYTR